MRTVELEITKRSGDEGDADLRGWFDTADYLFDAEGKLRSFAAGERGLDLLKATLDRVLAPAKQAATT